ncbi:MAG: hypothetical protein ACLQOO_13035 [Terriglobia bacterium]
MNHEYRHAWERCSSAIKSAILSEATLPERLEKAFDLNLRHLKEVEFPGEIWSRVEKLRETVGKRSAMPSDEAAAGLKEMLDIYDDVAEAYHGVPPQP